MQAFAVPNQTPDDALGVPPAPIDAASVAGFGPPAPAQGQPGAAVDQLGQWGAAKAALSLANLVTLGLLAGVCMGLGAGLSTLVVSDGWLGAGLSRWLGGLAFSLVFVGVVIGRAELWTGNCLMAVARARGHVSSLALARNLSVTLVANALGAATLAWVVVRSGALDQQSVRMATIRAAETTLALTQEQAFIKGLLAGALVCFAIWMTMATPTTLGKVIAVAFPISALVALGFEHSVADCYLIPAGLLLGANGVADDAIVTLGWIAVGNLLGGAIMTAAAAGITQLPHEVAAHAPNAAGSERGSEHGWASMFAGTRLHVATMVLLVLGGSWGLIARDRTGSQHDQIANLAVTTPVVATDAIRSKPPIVAEPTGPAATGRSATALPHAAPAHDEPTAVAAAPSAAAVKVASAIEAAIARVMPVLNSRPSEPVQKEPVTPQAESRARAAAPVRARIESGADAMIAFIEDNSRALDRPSWIVFDRLQFKPGTGRLTPDAVAEVRLIADILKAFPSVHIAVAGFGDSGTHRRRQRSLPEERARVVAKALIQRGIASGRLDTRGVADTQDFADAVSHDTATDKRPIGLLVTSR